MEYINTFLLTIVVGFIGIIIALVKRYIRRRKYALPPGPIGLPMIGHVTIFDHMSLLDHRDRFGDVSYINVMGNDIVVLNSVEAIRDALKGPTSDNFSDRPATFLKKYVMYDDIVFRSPHEANWKQLRQIFHSLLNQHGDGRAEQERVVTQELNIVIDLFNDKIDQVIDVKEYLEPSLINILEILAIGKRYNYDHWRIIESRKGLVYGNMLSHVFIDNLLKTIPILRFLPFWTGRVYQKHEKIRDVALEYILAEGRMGVDDDSKQGIIHEMFRMKERHDWITDDVIRGVEQDTIAAGFLTTRNTLCTFFLVLLHYPDVQARIQQEITSIIGDDRSPTTADRSHMPYTQAVIFELARYSSVASMSIPHACHKNTDFHGYTIPQNSVILPNLFRVHHDPELWDNPWRFDPLRFLDQSGELIPPSHPNRQNVIAFGVGKRVCMGEVFAKTRMFLYITFLLQHFTFEATDDLPSCDPRDFTTGVVLTPPDYTARLVKRISI